MFHSIYNGKKVLVTGHTGFKGSWLSLWLHELGAKVIGFAQNPYTSQDIFVRTNLSEKLIDRRGDINNFNELLGVFDEFKPDFVFHLAAQPIVRVAYDLPLQTFATNAMGTANVLQAIQQTDSVQGAVIITTDKVYQNTNSLWGYRECDPLGGHDPYSASKACAEIIIESFRKSFFSSKTGDFRKGVASARAGNVIGGGDWQKDRLIPDCIRALCTNHPIIVRNPKAIRPWQHVLEVIGAYLLLGERLLASQELKKESIYAEAWNFGPSPDSILTVEDLVAKIIQNWKSGEWKSEVSTNDIKHEAEILLLDISKSRFKLGWHPVLNIDECMELTIEWYKCAMENPTLNLYDVSRDQIKKYCTIAHGQNAQWLN